MRFPIFPNVLFLFKVPSKTPHYIQSSHLRSLGCYSFSDFPFFLLLPVLRIIGQVVCVMSLSWNLSDAFLTFRLRKYGLRKKIAEVKCHCYQITYRVLPSIRLITVDVKLNHLASDSVCQVSPL